MPLLEKKEDRGHLDEARTAYDTWGKRQAEFTDPAYDVKPKGLLRRKVDNPDARIRPELLAATVNWHAARDAVFTTDTGMATVWLSRFVQMTGQRRLVGSFNLGSMANAMPQALGASALDNRDFARVAEAMGMRASVSRRRMTWMQLSRRPLRTTARAARRRHQSRRGRHPAVPHPGAGMGLRDRQAEGGDRQCRVSDACRAGHWRECHGLRTRASLSREWSGR